MLDKLTHWLMLALIATIGGLIVALKLQGSRIHKLKIQLIQQTIENTNEKEEEKLAKLREAYLQSQKEYNNAQ